MTDKAFNRYFAALVLLLLFILGMMVCSKDSEAQTYAPYINSHVQLFDNNGVACAGCLLYTYSAGTSNPAATYKDNQGTANTNPIVLDSSGSAVIYFGAQSYKLVLQSALNVPIWTQDNVSNTGQLLSLNAVITNPSVGINQTITQQAGTSLTVGGSTNLQKLNQIRFADQFSGSDIGAKVNAAFTDCSNNCTVYIPAGSYSYSTTIAFPVSAGGTACLVGAGPQTVMTWSGLAGTDAIQAFGSSVSSANVCMKDFRIVGNSTAQSGIHLKGFNQGTIANVIVQGFSATGSANFFNDGVNAVSFYGCNSTTGYYGVRNVGNVALASSTNAIKWIGGQIAYNTKYNWFEDATASGTTGPNIGNSLIGATLEINSTNASGHIFEQLCTGCNITNNYIENDAGSTAANVITIGDGSNAPASLTIRDNNFADSATNTISDVNGQGTVAEGNNEAGAPTNFLNHGTSARGSHYGPNRATAATNYIAGSDGGADTDAFGAAGTTFINTYSTSASGRTFNSISGSGQDLVIRERSGSSGKIVNFLRNDATNEGYVDNTGNLAINKATIGGDTGFTAAPRMTFGGFIPTGLNTGAAGIARLVPDKAITITSLHYTVTGGVSVGAGCSTAPTIGTSGSCTSGNLILTNGAATGDLTGLSVNCAAGSAINLVVTTASIGCATAWTNVQATVQYKMQ